MDFISAATQTTAVLLGTGKSLFRDEHHIFGIGGRQLARASLISSVALLAADELRSAILTRDNSHIASSSILAAITARAVLLSRLPNTTPHDRMIRQFVANAACIAGTAISVTTQLAAKGEFSVMPTLFSAAAIWIGGQMDRQERQENATRLLVAASACWVPVAIITASPGLLLKTAGIDGGITALNIYRHYIRSRYEGSPPQKIALYLKDTARELGSTIHSSRSAARRTNAAGRYDPNP